MHGVRGGGNIPDFAAIFVEVRPAADFLTLHRGRIIRKRLPSGRRDILWRGERVAFATADTKGEPIAQRGRGRIGWWCATSPILGNRLDSVGAAAASPSMRFGAAWSISTP